MNVAALVRLAFLCQDLLMLRSSDRTSVFSPGIERHGSWWKSWGLDCHSFQKN